MRGCGRIERPAFPAPSDVSDAQIYRQNSRACGEIAEVCLAFVVPAKAGTHSPCRSFERRCSMTFAQQLRPVVIGPRVRGDDTAVIASGAKQSIFDLAKPSHGLLRLRSQ